MTSVFGLLGNKIRADLALTAGPTTAERQTSVCVGGNAAALDIAQPGQVRRARPWTWGTEAVRQSLRKSYIAPNSRRATGVCRRIKVATPSRVPQGRNGQFTAAMT